MYLLHAINSDRQTRLLNVLGQIAMTLGDKKEYVVCCYLFLLGVDFVAAINEHRP